MSADGSGENSKRRGAFVVFEGLDKSGKSLQSKMLVDALNSSSVPAELLKFPTRQGAVGAIVDEYLRKQINFSDETIHLLFSADRWDQKNSILDKLEQGHTLIVDRYAYSGVAFSAAKGLDLEWCIGCDRSLPAPDMVLLLNVSSEAALKREGFGDERYEKREFQNVVRKQYERLMRRDSDLGFNWKIINADMSVEEIHQEILSETRRLLNDSEKLHSPLRKLFT